MAGSGNGFQPRFIGGLSGRGSGMQQWADAVRVSTKCQNLRVSAERLYFEKTLAPERQSACLPLRHFLSCPLPLKSEAGALSSRVPGLVEEAGEENCGCERFRHVPA